MTAGERRYKYTLGIIQCRETNQILLLNRSKAPWMGRWNGVGGKLDPQESPRECIVRETLEETGLHLPQYNCKGVMKWFVDGEDLGGMYLFTAEVTKDEVEAYKTPLSFCHEGILDWKELDWVLHPENSGVVDNVQIMLKTLFSGDADDLYISQYSDKKLISFVHYPSGRLNELLNNKCIRL